MLVLEISPYDSLCNNKHADIESVATDPATEGKGNPAGYSNMPEASIVAFWLKHLKMLLTIRVRLAYASGIERR